MKKIFGYYGIAVVSVVVVLALFSILFGVSFENRQNLQQMLGTMIEEQLEQHTKQIRMGTAFDTIADHPLPNITLTSTDAIVKGKQVALTQFLDAHDTYGKVIDVYVKGVWNEDMKEDTSVQLIAQTHLLFASAGVYWLEVSASDAQGYQRNSMVKIYVKEG